MEPRPRVLITAPFAPDQALDLDDVLDIEVGASSTSDKSIVDGPDGEGFRSVAGVVCETDLIDQKALDAAPELRFVVATRANPVNVDVAACTERGIPVACTPGRNADVTADLAFGLLLSTVRQISGGERFLRAGEWNPEDPFEPYRRFRGIGLNGRVLGIVGGGAIGRRMAQRSLGFGMTPLVYDPFVSQDELADLAELTSLEDLLQRSDVVTIHAPLNEATRGLIGPEELALLRPEAFLVNAGRAAIVDEGALIEVLRSGRIAGAGFDVYWEEPVPTSHPLLNLANVTLLPHIGGASDDVVTEHSRMAADALRAWATGQTPSHVVNPEALLRRVSA